MKKNVLLVVVTIICVLVCALAFAACADTSEPMNHAHNYQWVDNGDGTHKQHCSVSNCDNPDVNSGVHNFVNGDCVCGAKKPSQGEHSHIWSESWDKSTTHHWHSCTADGCAITGNSQKDGYAEHIAGEAATITTPQTCIVCGYVITPPLGHTHSPTLVPAKPAQCTTSGNIAFYTCSCGKYFSDKNGKIEICLTDIEIGKLGHDWETEWTVDFEATTESAGSKSHHCSRCSEKTDITEIPRLIISEYDVTFILNYPFAPQMVKSTESGHVTYIPKRTGYIFNGWWYSCGQTADGSYILSEKFDTSERITQSGITLYAEWVPERTSDSQLYSPSVSISDSGVFSWSKVSNAQSYKVEVYSGANKVAEQSLTVTNWTFPDNMTAGYYTVKIRANGDGETTVSSAWTEKYYSYRMLGAAYIEYDISTSVLTWNTVENATAYEVRINNELKTTTDTTYDISDFDAGDYTVSVTPLREGWASSAAVNHSITKKRLKTPSVTLTQNNDFTYTVSWASVAHADTYRIKHHNTYINVTGTSYIVNNDSPIYNSNGTGEFTVIALDSNADYFISNDGESVRIGKLYKLTVNCNIRYGTTDFDKQIYGVGESVEITANKIAGYTWLGWCDAMNAVLTKEFSCTFVMPNNNVILTATWEENNELSNFKYTRDRTGVYITSVIDKTVTSIVVPKGVVGISKGAFSGCAALESIELPFVGNNGRSAGEYSFFGWIFGSDSYDGGTPTEQSYYSSSNKYYSYLYYIPASLISVSITGGEICDSAFIRCSLLKNIEITGVTSIGSDAFMDCSSLKSITIPDSVTSIGEYAFKGCSNLESITIPDSVTSIGRSAFSGCSSLESITFAENSRLAYIGDFAFAHCGSLISIEIPNGVMSIGENILGGCISLENITVVIGNTKFHSINNCLIETARKMLIAGCKNSKIPVDGSVTSIGYYAFYGCTGLTSIEIPNSVTSIGQFAFYCCSGLTSIEIPNSVTSVGKYAFSYCGGLTIYCEAVSMPSGWSEQWTDLSSVVWDYKNK